MTNSPIEFNDLVHRRAYRLDSRNLLVGFWHEKREGFIGVRRKFNDRYLFTEYHYDTGGSKGTATPLEALELYLPSDIPLRENLDTVCQFCKQPTESLWEDDPSFPSGQRCVGDRHLSETDCTPERTHFAYHPMNQAAFDLLDPYDQKFQQERVDKHRADLL